MCLPWACRARITACAKRIMILLSRCADLERQLKLQQDDPPTSPQDWDHRSPGGEGGGGSAGLGQGWSDEVTSRAMNLLKVCMGLNWVGLRGTR